MGEPDKEPRAQGFAEPSISTETLTWLASILEPRLSRRTVKALLPDTKTRLREFAIEQNLTNVVEWLNSAKYDVEGTRKKENKTRMRMQTPILKDFKDCTIFISKLDAKSAVTQDIEERKKMEKMAALCHIHKEISDINARHQVSKAVARLAEEWKQVLFTAKMLMELRTNQFGEIGRLLENVRGRQNDVSTKGWIDRIEAMPTLAVDILTTAFDKEFQKWRLEMAAWNEEAGGRKNKRKRTDLK